MINDYCEFFANIEKTSEKVIQNMTIQDYYDARDHVVYCDKCYAIVEKLSSEAPPQTFMDIIGEN